MPECTEAGTYVFVVWCKGGQLGEESETVVDCGVLGALDPPRFDGGGVVGGGQESMGRAGCVEAPTAGLEGALDGPP